MDDKTAIYDEQIMPLIKQIDAIATEHGMPFILVVQISDGGHRTSLNIPKHAHKEMKESAKWWLEGSKR